MTTDEALAIIEARSIMKVSAVCTDGSAFLIPVSPQGIPYDNPIRYTKAKILKLARLVESKPS